MLTHVVQEKRSAPWLFAWCFSLVLGETYARTTSIGVAAEATAGLALLQIEGARHRGAGCAGGQGAEELALVDIGALSHGLTDSGVELGSLTLGEGGGADNGEIG